MIVKTSTLILVWCLVASIAGPINCQKEEIYEDYEPDIGGGGGKPGDAPLVPGKNQNPKEGGGGSNSEKPGPDDLPLDEGENLEPEEADDPNKTKFTDQRFAKLFPSRSTRGGGRGLMPKPAYKPKPTLPSFIKSTPPLIKAQINTTPAPRGGNQLNRRQSGTVSTTRRSSVPSTTARPSRNRQSAFSSQLNSSNNNNSNSRQLTGRLSTTSAPARSASFQSSQSSQLSAAQTAANLAAARRRFGSSGISRFQRTHNRNETVSSLNPRGN